MLPEEVEARLEELAEPYAEELRETVEPEELVRLAADAARVAVDAERVAVETERLAVDAVRFTEEAEPAADGAVREAAAMRAEDLGAAEPEAAVVEPVPGTRVARTTRPTPLRGLAEMKVSWSPRVARLRPWYLGAI